MITLPLLAFTACGPEEVRVYEAPKSQTTTTTAPSQGPGPGHGAPGDMATPGHLHWELPTGWEETSSSGVRTATFRITGDGDAQAEVVIMPFKKMGGGDLQFVNLWRTTLGLEPVEEDRLPEMVEEVQIGDESAKLYDVMDPSPAGEPAPKAQIIVAMAIKGETSWFFKLAGDGSLVASQKDNFKEFLKTITFHEADAHGEPDSSTVASTATAPAHQFAPAAGDPSKPTWTVPESWQEVPPTSMLLAKFTLTGQGGGQADVTVSVFPGDVGGMLANVNRWRGQVGQAPVDASNLKESLVTLDVDGNTASLVDVTGSSLDSGDANRLIGVIVPRGGRTWFIKLLGNATVAGEQKEAFLQFLNSIKLPNA